MSGSKILNHQLDRLGSWCSRIVVIGVLPVPDEKRLVVNVSKKLGKYYFYSRLTEGNYTRT